MFNLLTSVYAGAASRNPGPFFIFALVFFGILLGSPFLSVIFGPDPYARFKTPEYTAEVNKSARQDLEARAQVYDYCKERKVSA